MVEKYDVNGFVETLPSLNQGRSRHGCGHFINSIGKKVGHSMKWTLLDNFGHTHVST